MDADVDGIARVGEGGPVLPIVRRECRSEHLYYLTGVRGSVDAMTNPVGQVGERCFHTLYGQPTIPAADPSAAVPVGSQGRAIVSSKQASGFSEESPGDFT